MLNNYLIINKVSKVLTHVCVFSTCRTYVFAGRTYKICTNKKQSDILLKEKKERFVLKLQNIFDIEHMFYILVEELYT